MLTLSYWSPLFLSCFAAAPLLAGLGLVLLKPCLDISPVDQPTAAKLVAADLAAPQQLVRASSAKPKKADDLIYRHQVVLLALRLHSIPPLTVRYRLKFV